MPMLCFTGEKKNSKTIFEAGIRMPKKYKHKVLNKWRFLFVSAGVYFRLCYISRKLILNREFPCCEKVITSC